MIIMNFVKLNLYKLLTFSYLQIALELTYRSIKVFNGNVFCTLLTHLHILYSHKIKTYLTRQINITKNPFLILIRTK